jgi:DNA-binding GntR family transcriptional regulator
MHTGESDDFFAPQWKLIVRTFLTQLYHLAGRPRLLTMIEDLRNASSAYLHLSVAASLPRDTPSSDREHREILAACQANDPQRAASAMRHHLQQTVKQVISMLERT